MDDRKAFGSESGCDNDVAKISLLNAAFPLVSHGQLAPADSLPNSPAITIVGSGSMFHAARGRVLVVK